MLDRIGKVFAVLSLPFWVYGFSVATASVVTVSNLLTMRFLTFVVGFAVFACIWRFSQRRLQSILTIEHELTHLLVALIFLKMPREFVVTSSNGGYVTYSGGSNFLITLAPYFLPTISYLLIPTFWFLPEKYNIACLGLLGVSVSFHFFSTRSEMHLGQTDLHKAGLLFSFVFLPAICLVFYGGILALVMGGTNQFVVFWKQSFQECINLFLLLLENIQVLISS